jgi:colanic acid/amylovoran biosynthesis glycosyltransferase
MKIAIVSPRKAATTETFINAHTLYLQGNKIIYHNGRIPKMFEDDVLTLSFPFLYRIFRKAMGMLGQATLSAEELAFKKSLQKEKPDVILAEYGTVGATIVPVVKKLGIPLVVHFHGFDASETKVLQEMKQDYLKMFEYSSAIIGVSIQMRDKLISIGAPKEKVHYTAYGPNDKFFENTPNYSSKTFLSVGRFIDKKAPHLTILAFKKCLEKHPDAKLKMIGGGPFFRICEELTNHFRLNSTIEFLGVQDSDFVKAEMQNAFCFIQHSRIAENGDMEGTPVAIIEAQAAALPVISTYHAGIPDIVVHGETGYLIEEGEVDKMADYMISLASDLTLAQEMGAKARKRIQENFTMKNHIETLDKIIASAIR